MNKIYYQIKDRCREGLLKYLSDAFIFIPKIENPKILDIGCGTGIPTLWLAENYGGLITAIDTDKSALDWLKQKIISKNLQDKITTLPTSFFDLKSDPDYFDLILAEGFLNIVGFEPGFLKVLDILKNDGYFIVHDEYKDHEKKCEFIIENNCTLAGTLFLDEKVWWNDYYAQIEKEINSVKAQMKRDIFNSELQEIKYYRSDPSPFRSIYYIVKKN